MKVVIQRSKKSSVSVSEKLINKINNKKLSKILISTYKILYFVFSIAIAIFILCVKLS